jgi:hypothetical protein
VVVAGGRSDQAALELSDDGARGLAAYERGPRGLPTVLADDRRFYTTPLVELFLGSGPG